jgi:2-methylisocitrate lyase-like PEP mutase family enzyme
MKLAEEFAAGGFRVETDLRPEKIGYKIVIYPVSTLFAATKAMMRLLQRLKQDGSTAGCLDDLVGFPEFNEIMGVGEMRALEKKFADSL